MRLTLLDPKRAHYGFGSGQVAQAIGEPRSICAMHEKYGSGDGDCVGAGETLDWLASAGDVTNSSLRGAQAAATGERKLRRAARWYKPPGGGK